MKRPERRRLTALALGAAVALAASCTGAPAPPGRGDGGPGLGSLEGVVLLTSGGGLGADVQTLELPSSRTSSTAGIDEGFLFDATIAPDGRPVLLMFDDEEQLGRVFVSAGQDARRVGPPLADLNRLMGFSGGRLVGATCSERGGAIWLLDLARPQRWVRGADAGCRAVLSPDGSTVAFPGAGRLDPDTLWQAPVGGGEPEPLLSLADLADELLTAGVIDPRVDDLSWGEGGLAIQFVAGEEEVGGPGFGPGFDHVAMVVVAPERTTVVPLTNTFADQMAWQPGGHLLAFSDCIECYEFRSIEPHGEIRVLDPTTGEIRQVASSRDGFGGLAWSPDGRSLVTRWREGELLFLDLRGREVGRIPIDAFPWAWGQA